MYSTYYESAIWSTVHYINTTICESYFHWLAIFIPKWANTLPAEYTAREAAAFLIFKLRRRDKILCMKSLAFNKNVQNLVATAGQKTYANETFLTMCLQELLPSDANTMRYVNVRIHRFTKAIRRRLIYARKCSDIVGSDIVAQNRGLGLHDSSPRVIFSTDGMMSGRQLVESNTSLKTCTLFPFMKESLILSTEHLENFYKVIAKDHLKTDRTSCDANPSGGGTTIQDLCNHCALPVDTFHADAYYRCFLCSHCLHVDCSPHNWNRSTDDDGIDVFTCNTCFLENA